MKFRSLILGGICAAALFAGNALALPIDYFTGSVAATDPIQLGRPSRNGVPQTWTGQESYPGVINTTTVYHYTTYTYIPAQLSGGTYIDLTVFDTLGTNLTFLSAYANSYNPNNRAQNWLGDEGSSGDYQFFAGTPGDARFFDVFLPANANLILVANTTGGGLSGTNNPYDIAINAFSDTQYTDPIPATPEPSTFIELGTGMLVLAGMLRRRLNLR